MNSVVCSPSDISILEEASDFAWVSVGENDFHFLGSLRALFDDNMEIFVPASLASAINRSGLDGTWFLRGSIGGFPLALVWNDFRVNGASTSKAVAATYTAFLAAMEPDPRPLLIGIKTMGVRFMEGRTVFPHAFSILPALNRYRQNHLVLTLAHGNTLGLGTLIFGMGHYRMAVREESCINLTGPEVCKMVFGKQVSFEQIASNEIQFRNTGLIHELTDTLAAAFARLPLLLELFATGATHDRHIRHRTINQPADEFIAGICDNFVELFPHYDERLKAYIGICNGEPFGILINPPQNPNNMIRARTLVLVEDALTLFQKLHLPVVSLMDTPGADPRMDGTNRLIIEKLISASQKIIEYPYRKMGIVIGRAYGGASVIGFPKFFGGDAVYALEHAHVGIMHESIITQLLSGSARLSAQWQEVAATQTFDLKDLLDGGYIDGVIRRDEIRGKIEKHILAPRMPQAIEYRRRVTDVPDRHRPMTHHHLLREAQGNRPN